MKVLDLSKLPAKVTITNADSKDSKVSLSGHSQSFTLSAGASVDLWAKTSSELLGYVSLIKYNNLKISLQLEEGSTGSGILPTVIDLSHSEWEDINSLMGITGDGPLYGNVFTGQLDPDFWSSLSEGKDNLQLTYIDDGVEHAIRVTFLQPDDGLFLLTAYSQHTDLRPIVISDDGTSPILLFMLVVTDLQGIEPPKSIMALAAGDNPDYFAEHTFLITKLEEKQTLQTDLISGGIISNWIRDADKDYHIADVDEIVSSTESIVEGQVNVYIDYTLNGVTHSARVMSTTDGLVPIYHESSFTVGEYDLKVQFKGNDITAMYYCDVGFFDSNTLSIDRIYTIDLVE